MNGRNFTLGALAGLAVAGMVAQRGRGSAARRPYKQSTKRLFYEMAANLLTELESEQ